MKKTIKEKDDASDFYKIFKPELTPKKNDGIGCFWRCLLWTKLKRIS